MARERCTAINTLLKKKWIEPIGNETNSSKKEHIATKLGREIAENEMKRIRQINGIAAKIIGGESN